MSFRSQRPNIQLNQGNLGNAERWFCTLAGLGLTVSAVRGKGFFRRLSLGATGLSLLARGVTGYCPAKAVLTGSSPSWLHALDEQWYRLKMVAGARHDQAREVREAIEVRRPVPTLNTVAKVVAPTRMSTSEPRRH